MKLHIHQTLTDIDHELTCLQTLRASLLKFADDANSSPTSPPSPTGPTRPTAVANRKPKINNHSTPHRVAGVDPRSVRSLTIIAGLTEPFSFAQTAKAGTSNSFIYNLAAKGWVKKTDTGYFRTGKFPNLDAAPAPSAARPKPAASHPFRTPVNPIEKPANSSLQKRMEDACKQRDHARANGRTEVAQMFQDEIEGLEKQISAS